MNGWNRFKIMQTATDKFLQLLEANRILSSTLNLADLLREVMRLATGVVEAESSSLLLYDEKTDELVFDLALTEKENQLKSIRIKNGEGIAGWVASNKKSRVVNNAASDPQWTNRADEHTSFKTRSLLAVPMIYKGKLLGVVEAVNKRSGDFTQDDCGIFEAFAAQSAVAIENARLFSDLQEEKDKMQAVFTQMSDGALLVDSTGRKLLVNDAARKLLGEENVSKESLQDIFSGFTADPPVETILTGGSRSTGFEFSREQGKTFFVSGIANKILDQDGKVFGLIFIFRDITEEKKESVLKRNFFSLMSHKLKTPLVTITGYGPLLLETPLNDMQKKAITSIHKQGTYLASLVDKLLNAVSVESGKLVLEKGRNTYQRTLEKALESLKLYIEQKNAEIAIDGKVNSLPAVYMDFDKVEIALRNLIENAVKFNKSDKIKVSILPCEEKGFVGISVADNGPGIPPEERGKVFQKFYQIEESFTGQVEGAGLGLALIRQIAEAHGGKVRLESEIGKGSRFDFLLPVN